MKPLIVSLLSGIALCAAPADWKSFAGRWDLTVATANETYPSWMEVREQGGKPVVNIVGRVASVHAATDVTFQGSRVSFTTSEWFGKPTKVTWNLSINSGHISGTQKRATGVEGRITGVPAPELDRKAPARWSNPKPLFNGKDLSGWQPDRREPEKSSQNYWKARNGELINEKPGANLETAEKFQDFRLHIEYNCPERGNSGIYLRGRYEIQVAYEPAGENDKFHDMGSIYGFLAASRDLPRRPGQWEMFDVTLVGRRVTIMRNGIPIIENQEIPGITGGALDSLEAEPGPLYIQGDHTGGMKYRNITISVPQS